MSAGLEHLQPWAVQVDGVWLRGEHSVPSGKPVLHFMHGNGLNCRVYQRMLAPLQADFDLWLVDLPGHGLSDADAAHTSWADVSAKAMQAWRLQRAQFGGVKVLACGHSYGAVLTLLAMHNDAQLFSGAVLLDPVLFTSPMLFFGRALDFAGLLRRHPFARTAARRRAHWPSRDAALAYFSGRGIFKRWQRECVEDYIEHGLLADAQGGYRLRCAPEREAQIFASMPWRLWSAIKHVRVPVHIIYGAHTYAFTLKSLPRAVRLNPQISVEEVPGGHTFMQENPIHSATVLGRQLRKL